MKRVVSIAIVVLVLGIGMVGERYLSWVKNWGNAESPFDEVGIDLHSYMPSFVQDWGCAQLKAEFGQKTLPPYGCSGADGRSWR